MPPKIMFSRDDILRAALSLVEEKGIGELSARKVGERLGSSQAPIYGQFDSIDALKVELFELIRDKIIDYVTRNYSQHVFLNLGVGFAVFSRNHPNLYQAISLNKEMMTQLLDKFAELMATDERFTSIPLTQRRSILNKMVITTCGLAELMAKGLIDDTSDEAIIQTLQEIGSAFISVELNKLK